MTALLTFLAIAGNLCAAPVIAGYSAEIRRDSAAQYVVTVTARVEGGAWARPGFTLGPFYRGAFEGCVTCEAQPQGILQRLTPVTGADGTFEVQYRVAAAAAGEREYIPLAVPEIAGTARPGSVDIAVLPGQGMAPDGDMFPVLAAASEGRWTARMANMVNHVEFHPGAQPRFGPRQWSDLAVAVMILCGLLLRSIITQKAKSA